MVLFPLVPLQPLPDGAELVFHPGVGGMLWTEAEPETGKLPGAVAEVVLQLAGAGTLN